MTVSFVLSVSVKETYSFFDCWHVNEASKEQGSFIDIQISRFIDEQLKFSVAITSFEVRHYISVLTVSLQPDIGLIYQLQQCPNQGVVNNFNTTQQQFANKMGRQEIKWKLQIIFVYYTSYADRNNFRFLKQQNYRRFLIDSDSVRHTSSFVYFDIAFQKINHSAIIYKQFLKLLPELAQLCFKGNKITRSEAFRLYVRDHIEPLFREILDKSEFGRSISTLVRVQYEEKLLRALAQVQAIDRIYHDYIKCCIQNKEAYQVFESLTVFLKDFDICPHILSKSISYLIFLYLLKDKQIDSVLFQGQDLLKFLIIASQIETGKLLSEQLCTVGKLTKLLERMELSAGFESINKKILYETAVNHSLLKSFNTLISKDHEENDHCLQKMEQDISRMFPSSTRHKNCGTTDFELQKSPTRKKEELKMSNFRTVKSIANESVSFSKDYREIRIAFEELCSYGEVANNRTLKSYKVKKLFERINLIKSIGKPWVDIQIVNLQRGSESGKVEFPQFIELLSLTAQKVGLSFDEICMDVLKDKHLNDKQKQLSPSLNNSTLNAINETNCSQEDIEMVRLIMKSAQKQVQKIYSRYTKDITHHLMSFNEMWKAMYDFEVFPSVISKNRLFQIFSELSDIREQNSLKNSVRTNQLQTYLLDEKRIQFSGFIMGLIQIAQQIVQRQLQPPQKLILLLQKINESKNYKKITPISLVQEIRHKFANYYLKSFHKDEEHIESFDELLEGL